MRLFVVAFAAAALFAARADADVVTVIAGRDNTLYQDAGGALSNGSGDSVFAGRTGSALIRRGLLFFDVAAAVPAGATITAASMTLNQTLSRGTPASFTLHRVAVNWGEGASNAGSPGGQGAPAAANDATWLHAFSPSVFFATIGGDFAGIASATTTIGNTAGPYTWTSAQLALDVQAWRTTPTTNFGWLVRDDELVNRVASRFASRENATAGLRPMLTITFTPVPEPTSFVLVGVVAAGWAARRRSRS